MTRSAGLAWRVEHDHIDPAAVTRWPCALDGDQVRLQVSRCDNVGRPAERERAG